MKKTKTKSKFINKKTDIFEKALKKSFGFEKHEKAILYGVLLNYDQFITAALRIQRDGVVTSGKKHPAFEIKTKSWTAVLAGLRALNIGARLDDLDGTGKPGPKRKKGRAIKGEENELEKFLRKR